MVYAKDCRSFYHIFYFSIIFFGYFGLVVQWKNVWLTSRRSLVRSQPSPQKKHMWGGEEVSREAHNLQNASSILAPATIVKSSRRFNNSFKRVLLNAQDRAVGQLAHDHKWEVEGSSPSLATNLGLFGFDSII